MSFGFVLCSTLILFCLGFITHFIYKFSHKNLIVGLFFPANESVWEHLKLLPVSAILFYILYYYLNVNSLNADGFFTLCLVLILAESFLIISFYYLIKHFFGKPSVFVDVMNYLVSIFLGTLIGTYFYNNGLFLSAQLSISIISLIITMLIVLTVFPLKLPIFFDNLSKTYGIQLEQHIESNFRN